MYLVQVCDFLNIIYQSDFVLDCYSSFPKDTTSLYLKVVRALLVFFLIRLQRLYPYIYTFHRYDTMLEKSSFQVSPSSFPYSPPSTFSFPPPIQQTDFLFYLFSFTPIYYYERVSHTIIFVWGNFSTWVSHILERGVFIDQTRHIHGQVLRGG